jgi:hypothetical protein
MIRRIRALRDRWLGKLRAAFKKKRFSGKLDLRFDPLAMDEEINCPCHYGAPSCGLHRGRTR